MTDDLTGTRLGKHEIKFKIREDRSGILYEAHDTENDWPVVVKVISTPLPADSMVCHRFGQYAQALTELNHPNILKIYDYGIDPESGQTYLVMPFVGGGTLGDRLGQPWPVEDAVRIAAEVAQALSYAHQRGIVHGDVQPDNILLTQRGWPLLANFGLSEFFESKSGAEGRLYRPRGATSTAQIGPAADLYALVAILYEMLGGHPPFLAGSGDETSIHEEGGPPSLCRSRTDIPRELDQTICKMLTPGEVPPYATARELALDLVNLIPSGTARSLGQRVTPPSGIRAVEPRQQPVSSKAMPADGGARTVLHAPRKRILHRSARWILDKAVTVLLTLVLMLLALLVGGAFALGKVVERALAVQQWSWIGWENGGTATILEADLQQPLQNTARLYTLGILTDLGLDLRPPDIVEIHAHVGDWPLNLQAQLVAQDNILHIQLERLNGIRLYVVGGIVSKGINRGLTAAWEGAPVRLASLEVHDGWLQAVLEPWPGSEIVTLTPFPTPIVEWSPMPATVESETEQPPATQTPMHATDQPNLTAPSVPIPLSPADNAVLRQGGLLRCPCTMPGGVRGGLDWEFDWEDSRDASGILRYHLMIQGPVRNLSFEAFPTKSNCRFSVCDIIVDASLEPWACQVRAQDNEGNWSEWSEPRMFSVQSLGVESIMGWSTCR